MKFDCARPRARLEEGKALSIAVFGAPKAIGSPGLILDETDVPDLRRVELLERLESGLWGDIVTTMVHDDAEKLPEARCNFTHASAALTLDEWVKLCLFATQHPGVWYTQPRPIDMATHAALQYPKEWALWGARLGGRFEHRPQHGKYDGEVAVTKRALIVAGTPLRTHIWTDRRDSPIRFVRAA
jgi:hypothetical protein